MKLIPLKHLLGVLALWAPLAASAEGVLIQASHVGVGIVSGSPANYTWYHAQQSNVDFLDNAFDGSSFGPFVQGSSAYLSTAELMTSGGASVTGATLHYCVYSGAACGGSFVDVGLGLGAEADGISTTFTDAGGRVYDVAGDRQLNGMAPVDFLAGLGAGDFTIELYYSAAILDINGLAATLFSNNDGANYRATFSVTGGSGGGDVPEPTSLTLAGLTLALLAATRRRR